MPLRPKQIIRLTNRLSSKKKRGGSSGSKKEDLTAKHVYKVAKKGTFPTASQWKRLPDMLGKRERTIFNTSSIVAVLALLVFLFGLYFTNRIIVPAVGGEYTEGLVGEPQFLNPILATSSTADMDLTTLVFRGLFKMDPVEGLVPDVANGYELSEDEKVYTVFLKNNVRWHDGETLTARDVVFTFQAIRNPEYNSPLAVTFGGIQVEAVDDTTITFTMQESFAPFLSSLTVGILPAHVWEGIAPKRAALTSLNLQPIGNGPYRFDKFSKDQNGAIRSYTLRPFKDFYGNTPRIEKLTFKFYSSIEEAVDALKNRNVEGLAFIPEERATEFENSRQVTLFRPSIPQETLIFFNQKRNEVLKNKKVREALNLSVSREEILEDVFRGHGAILSSPLLPNTFGEKPEPTTQDMGAAEVLLDEAGWKRNADSPFRQKETENDEPDTLTIELVTVNTPDMIAMAEHVKRAWDALGVDTVLSVVDPGVFQTETISTRAYDALLTGILFGADPDPFVFWHSSQITEPGVNLAGYSSRKADAELEKGRTTVDHEVRSEAYSIFQDIVIADLPALFLIQPTYSYATASKIKGIELNQIVVPSDRFNGVENWYTKTKKVFRLGEDSK